MLAAEEYSEICKNLEDSPRSIVGLIFEHLDIESTCIVGEFTPALCQRARCWLSRPRGHDIVYVNSVRSEKEAAGKRRDVGDDDRNDLDREYCLSSFLGDTGGECAMTQPYEFLQRVVRFGANVRSINMIDEDRDDAFYVAAEAGDNAVLALILQHCPATRVNKRYPVPKYHVGPKPWRLTPLERAAGHGHADTVRFLLGVEDCRERKHHRAVLCATRGGHVATVRLLLRHCSAEGAGAHKVFSVEGTSPLHAAAGRGDVVMLDVLLKDPVMSTTVNLVDHHQKTPLECANGARAKERILRHPSVYINAKMWA